MAEYEYLNTRTRAMKAALLSRARLRQLAQSESLIVFIETLGATTPYAAELRRAATAVSDARACDRALVRQMASVFRSVWRDASEGIRVWLGLWLAPWDLANIKVILRGWQSQLTADEIEDGWVAAGTLSRRDLRRLVAAGTPRGLAKRLAARGGMFHGLARAIGAADIRGLREVEDALDREWAAYAAVSSQGDDDDARSFAGFLAWEVDARNLLTALRLARDGAAAEGEFLAGGRRVNRSLWSRVADCDGIERAWIELEGTALFEAVRAETPPYEMERALDRIERRVRALVLGGCGRIYSSSDPLGIAVLLRFVQLKATEVTDLRSIAYGLAEDLPSGLIEEGLSNAQGQGDLR